LPPLPRFYLRVRTGRARNGPSIPLSLSLSPGRPAHPSPGGKKSITVPKTLFPPPSIPPLHVRVCVCSEAILPRVGKRTCEERFRPPTKRELLLLYPVHFAPRTVPTRCFRIKRRVFTPRRLEGNRFRVSSDRNRARSLSLWVELSTGGRPSIF